MKLETKKDKLVITSSVFDSFENYLGEKYSSAEATVSKIKDEKELFSLISSLRDFFLLIEINNDVFSLSKNLFMLSKNVNKENIEKMKEIINALPVNFEIKNKAIDIAVNNIIDYCNNFTCSEEEKRFVEWLKKNKERPERIKKEQLPDNLKELKELVKKREYKLSENLYLSSFVYSLLKAREKIEKSDIKGFVKVIKDIEKDFQDLAVSISLKNVNVRGKTLKSIVEQLNESGVIYDITVSIDDFFNNSGKQEMHIKAKSFEIIIKKKEESAKNKGLIRVAKKKDEFERDIAIIEFIKNDTLIFSIFLYKDTIELKMKKDVEIVATGRNFIYFVDECNERINGPFTLDISYKEDGIELNINHKNIDLSDKRIIANHI
jgi:hypothetical protein